MPAYDYQCEKCECVFEVERAFGATTRVKCPKCGSVRTLRVFSPSGIVFKGSGFHVTDYKPRSVEDKGDNSGSKADKLEKPTETAKATESKPAKEAIASVAAKKDKKA